MEEEKIYSLCEAVADISFIAGERKYYSGNSREDISNFISWAKEFEKINKAVEWGVNSKEDYFESIYRFASYKMEKIH